MNFPDIQSDKNNRRMLGKKAVILVTSSMTIMAGAIISPSLPEIQAAFQEVPNVEILTPLVLTITALFIAIFAPIAGLIIDRFGRKPLLLASLTLYGLAGSSGLYLNSIWDLIIGRVLLGTAVGGLVTCTATLIADYFSGIERQKFMGFRVAFINFGGVVFLVAGGFLADLSWRAPFALYLMAFIVLPCAYMWIEEPRLPGKIGRDIQKPSQAIPWSYILLLYGIGSIGWIIFYIIPVKLPFYLKEMTDASATQIGIATGQWSFIGAIVASQYQHIRKFLSYLSVFAVLFLVTGLGFGILAFADRYSVVMYAMTLCGLGFGFMMPNILIWLSELAPLHVRGRILGGSSTCNFLGQFLSPLAFQPIIATSGLGGTLGAYGITSITAFILGLCFLVWALFFPIKTPRLKDETFITP
ncbi:MAG: MFS transporter [Deltaproteobacteria bacterium]|nr:MFS transporter [Deltaproteobacteria bacterium]